MLPDVYQGQEIPTLPEYLFQFLIFVFVSVVQALVIVGPSISNVIQLKLDI
jgi:hypothetical protein